MKFMKPNRSVLALLLATVMLLTMTACRNKEPDPTEPEQTTTRGDVPTEGNNQTAFLGNHLYITDVGDYTGIYMEDGADEFVSDVLMIILKNEGDTDLQLARIKLEYADFTANFEATNLPAGESVVLLEKNRHAYVKENFFSAAAENVAFFREPMSLREDQLKLTGTDGAITVENLTDQPLGELYIYYKNSASDLYYGGITYRARVNAGLKPGESNTIATKHYHPKSCTILDVQIMPVEE